MKKNIINILAAVALSVLPMAARAQSLEGYWKGLLDLGASTLEVCFDIQASTDSTYTATLDVPQQGAEGIAVDTFVFDGFNVTMEIKSIGASYKGLSALGMITGNFSQNGLEIPLVLKRGEKEGVKRPQTPQPPFPYRSEEVTFNNSKDGLTLAGTLTTPEGEGPCNAVVLITGSGAQNRDEEIMGHRPFAVIADYLTRHGIAVLRYDDRGVGGSQAGPEGATSLDLSHDAEAAVQYLRSLKKFNQIGVAGHSEGGLIAWLLGSGDAVDFIVSLAGPAVSGAAVLDAQRRALYGAMGLSQDAIEQNAALFDMLNEIIFKSGTPEEARPEAAQALAMLPAAQRQQILDQLLDPWMFWFSKYDPAGAILATRCPILALGGSKDLQVVAEQNLGRLRELKEQNDGLDIEIVELPELNHLFQHCDTGLNTEYGLIEETFAEEALEKIAEFISER